jgi:hypothetical protein
MKLKWGLIILLGVLVLGGCGKSAQDQETYYLEKAQHQINIFDYTGALSTLSLLDQNKPQVITLTASALAGRAGFNTLALADMITTHQNNPLSLLTTLNADYGPQALADIYRATQLLNSQNDFPSRLQYASLQVYKVSQIVLKNYLNQDHMQICSSDSVVAANDLIDIIISLNLSLVKVQEIVTNIYDYVQRLEVELGINPNQLDKVQITEADITSLRNTLTEQIKNTLNTTVDLCEVH